VWQKTQENGVADAEWNEQQESAGTKGTPEQNRKIKGKIKTNPNAEAEKGTCVRRCAKRTQKRYI
jgi:hypothetical protein